MGAFVNDITPEIAAQRLRDVQLDEPMKALVVGGAGYIGSVVTRLLVAEGHEVVVLDDCSTGHADSVPAGVELVETDITDVGDGAGRSGLRRRAAFRGEIAGRRVGGQAVAVLADQCLRHQGPAGRDRRATLFPRLVFSSTAATYGEPDDDPDHRGRPDPADQHLRRDQARRRHDDHRRMRGHRPGRRVACATSTWPVPRSARASGTASKPI